MRLEQMCRFAFAGLCFFTPVLACAAQSATKPVVVRRPPATSTAIAQPVQPTPVPPANGAGEQALVALQDQGAIKALLDRQAADWNRGDLDAFAQGYKRSPDILFMGGPTIYRGYDSMLARYKASYPSRERMGQLTFSELEVQPLGGGFATVTGHFHLERTGAGGGNANGFFLLVLEKTTEGWKVVRDDTTPLPSRGR